MTGMLGLPPHVVQVAKRLALVVASVLVALALGACGGADRHVESATAVAPPPRDARSQPFPDDPRSWGRFHSKRFAMTIPLPDGRAWRIDDHTRPTLMATHPRTGSELVVSTWIEPDLVNRQRCEERARATGLVPEAPLSTVPRTSREPPPPPLHTVSDEVTVGPDAYDTRLWIAIAPGANESSPITGHVFAFGAYVHKCLFFHFTTEVPGAKDEDVLGDRLATARVRVFGALKLDDFDTVPRQRSGQ